MRTFEDINAYRQNKIAGLLHAVSQSIEGGYFQGLNMLVFFVFQAGLGPEQAYWVLMYVLQRQGLHSLIRNNFRLYRGFEHLLEHCLEAVSPETATSLRRKTQGLSYFVMRWVLSLFTYDLSAELAQAVWLQFMDQGLPFLGGAALAIFEVLAPQIHSLDEEALNELLKHELASALPLEPQEFVARAGRLAIPWQEYLDWPRAEFIVVLGPQGLKLTDRQQYVALALDLLEAPSDDEKEVEKGMATEDWDEEAVFLE